MRNIALRSAVVAALGLASFQASAAWVSLPSTGFAVTAGTNQVAGTTAFVRCNTTGNYGSGSSTPATSTADACHVVPTGGSRNTSPDPAIATPLISSTRPLVVNYNGGGNVTVGQIEERVWRNANSTSCVYGLRLSLAEEVDYDLTTPGIQTLELNGFARGGFSGLTVSAGYFHSTVSDEAVFRIGRAFTSVQMRASTTSPTTTPAPGYVHRPINSPAPAAGTAVNGAAWGSPLPVPTAGQQTAAIRDNWVEFTTDNNADDDDGTSKPDSSQFYVRANACPAANAEPVAGAYRFRQFGQEEAPLFEFTTSGYIPAGANTNY